MISMPLRKKYIRYGFVVVFVLLGYIFGDAIPSKPLSTTFETPPISRLPTKFELTHVSSKSAEFFVTKVVDGDTFTVEIAEKKETIRLIGIDTPEVVDPRKPVQCYGREASEKAKELLYGKTVTLINDPTQGDRDTYKRLLRYAFLEDGTNVNEYMITEGYAHEYTYQSKPYIYQNEFKAAERNARENKKGLWADDACL